MRRALSDEQAVAVAAAICGLGGTYSDSQFVDLLYDLAASPPVVAEQRVEAIVTHLARLHVPEPTNILICDLFGEGEPSHA